MCYLEVVLASPAKAQRFSFTDWQGKNKYFEFNKLMGTPAPPKLELLASPVATHQAYAQAQLLQCDVMVTRLIKSYSQMVTQSVPCNGSCHLIILNRCYMV